MAACVSPNGKALRGPTHDYKINGTPNLGTTNLFAALAVHQGIAYTGYYRRERRREYLDFTNGIVSQDPDTEFRAVLDDSLPTDRSRSARLLTGLRQPVTNTRPRSSGPSALFIPQVSNMSAPTYADEHQDLFTVPFPITGAVNPPTPWHLTYN